MVRTVAKVELDKILSPPKEDHTRTDFQEPEAGSFLFPIS